MEFAPSADGEQLPLEYDPELIAGYWERRPVAVTTRILQLLSVSGAFLGRMAVDAARGRLQETQVCGGRGAVGVWRGGGAGEEGGRARGKGGQAVERRWPLAVPALEHAGSAGTHARTHAHSLP